MIWRRCHVHPYSGSTHPSMSSCLSRIGSWVFPSRRILRCSPPHRICNPFREFSALSLIGCDRKTSKGGYPGDFLFRCTNHLSLLRMLQQHCISKAEPIAAVWRKLISAACIHHFPKFVAIGEGREVDQLVNQMFYPEPATTCLSIWKDLEILKLQPQFILKVPQVF